MYKLKYAVQNYSWGKCGYESEVHNLSLANDSHPLNENLPYAELWLGTHVSGTSVIESTKKKLSDLINENPDVLGDATLNEFGKTLPFLLKVLSVNTALSIQIHPNKKEAEFLHKTAQDVYKDPNHKPELAIALTGFEALVGFRKLEEITHFINSIPQLGGLVGDIKKGYLNLISEEQRVSALKVCYKTIMLSSQEKITGAISSLVSDFHNGKAVEYLTEKHAHLAELFLRLNTQYPNDVGCFSVFLLNRVFLNPGEAIFLAANIPHAYISGTCIECMACSDNVIRAGLTPKYKDIETLISMVNYSSFSVDDLKYKCESIPSISDSITCDLFSPPIPDFAVERISAMPSSIFHAISTECHVPSIILVIEGTGILALESEGKIVCKNPYKRGNSFFLAANLQINIQVDTKSLVFRAFVNVPEEKILELL